MDYQGTIIEALQSYGIIFAVIFGIFGIIMGGFSGWIASTKGYDSVAWFFLGFLFGLIALLVIGFSPVKKFPAEATADGYDDSDQRSLQATQMEKLQTLLDSGRITRAEFDNAKAQILGYK
jgi:hypothetical protein